MILVVNTKSKVRFKVKFMNKRYTPEPRTRTKVSEPESKLKPIRRELGMRSALKLELKLSSLNQN